MASMKNSLIAPLALRSVHLVLHLVSFILVLMGMFELPNPMKKGKLLEAAHARAKVWLVFELFYCLLGSAMLISSVVNLTVKSPQGYLNRIKVWSRENCPNFSFFYYVLVSLFVLYGAMIGCNIPMLFNKVPIFGFPSPNRPTKKWQFILIAAAITEIINSILYFVAAFYPLQIESNEEPSAKVEDTKEETDAPISAEDEIIKVQNDQEMKTNEDKIAESGEMDTKSDTG